MAKRKPKRKKEPRILCPIDCIKCKWNRACMVYDELKLLRARLRKTKDEKERKRIQDILDILEKRDTLEDLYGKKKERR